MRNNHNYRYVLFSKTILFYSMRRCHWSSASNESLTVNKLPTFYKILPRPKILSIFLLLIWNEDHWKLVSFRRLCFFLLPPNYIQISRFCSGIAPFRTYDGNFHTTQYTIRFPKEMSGHHRYFILKIVEGFRNSLTDCGYYKVKPFWVLLKTRNCEQRRYCLCV